LSAGSQGKGGVFGSGRDGQDTFVAHTLKGEDFDASEDGIGRGEKGQIVNALNAQSGETGQGDAAPCVAVANTLAAYAGRNQVEQNYLPTTSMAVRRLTPRECEALQGFPADYTLIPWRNKPAADCPDGPRYKALGNSMAVPCMRWIGTRINAEALR
jgi:DNA (cytosine-5)-methyltransferase 1